MTPELKYKVQKCGELLAQSLLANEIKETIIANVSNMTESQLDQVISSLERETIELVALTEMIKSFDKKQDVGWTNLERAQQDVARDLVNTTFEQAKKG